MVKKCENCTFYSQEEDRCYLKRREFQKGGVNCKRFEPAPIINEDELTDWLSEEVDAGGFSPSATIDKWDKEGIHPLEITITLEYKTGDGVDQPYGDYPPDESIAESLESKKWEVDYEGIMHYGLYCPKCDKEIEYGEEEYSKEEVAICPECKSELEELTGAKWIRGYKKLKLKGNETAEEIKELIEEAINEVI